MLLFEIRCRGRLCYIPENTPLGFTKERRFNFPNAQRTGIISAFCSIGDARSFFKENDLPDIVEAIEYIDTDAIRSWIGGSVELCMDIVLALDLLHCFMSDFYEDLDVSIPSAYGFDIIYDVFLDVFVKAKLANWCVDKGRLMQQLDTNEAKTYFSALLDEFELVTRNQT